MRRLVREDLEDYRDNGGAGFDEKTLLAALPVNLNDDGITDYLVYPASYHPALLGAHSIEFWAFRGNQDNTCHVVLNEWQDAMEILPSKTNGMRDIETAYGRGSATDYTLYRYNKNKMCYEKTSTRTDNGE